MNDEEREAFETHIENTEGSKPRLWAQIFASSQNNPELPAQLEGVYFMRDNQKAWLAWQRRAAREAALRKRLTDLALLCEHGPYLEATNDWFAKQLRNILKETP